MPFRPTPQNRQTRERGTNGAHRIQSTTFAPHALTGRVGRGQDVKQLPYPAHPTTRIQNGVTGTTHGPSRPARQELFDY